MRGDYFVMMEAHQEKYADGNGCVAMADSYERAQTLAIREWQAFQKWQRNAYRIYIIKARDYRWLEFDEVGFDSDVDGDKYPWLGRIKRHVALGMELTASEWAEKLKVTSGTIRQWVKNGTLEQKASALI